MTETGWQRSWVRILTTLLTAAVMVMIFAFSTEDAEHSDRTSGLISRSVMSIIHPEYEQLEESRQKLLYDDMQHIVRKCAHFTEYMVLGLMLRLCLETAADIILLALLVHNPAGNGRVIIAGDSKFRHR